MGINHTKTWSLLETHAKEIVSRVKKNLNIHETDKQRFCATAHTISLDFSHQHISNRTLQLLFSLAQECQLPEKIDDLFQGEKVNRSEGKPALHTALRVFGEKKICIDGDDIIPFVMAEREKIRHISEKIRNQQWTGFSGKPIRDIVNIGIGGSDLGPRFCLRALAEFSIKGLGYHFISDADPEGFENVVINLKPETTLFIISSKSFTTNETLFNAKKAVDWLGDEKALERNMIAVTANVEKAYQFGIKTVLQIWDWVGGRFSACSAINLITTIAIGYDQFIRLLEGAHFMDKHFHTSPFAENLPILLALLGIWNNNFLHTHNVLMLTYSQKLEYLVPYIQQLDMESNGKSVDCQGRAITHATGPIIWGGLGNQAQHSYYQLICQGTHKITADFISIKAFEGEIINRFCDAKIKVLTQGVDSPDNAYATIPGNVALNHLRLANCSPFTIGALIALYEHKIYTQSVIWNINPFDQPGVESAKRESKLIES